MQNPTDCFRIISSPDKISSKLNLYVNMAQNGADMDDLTAALEKTSLDGRVQVTIGSFSGDGPEVEAARAATKKYLSRELSVNPCPNNLRRKTGSADEIMKMANSEAFQTEYFFTKMKGKNKNIITTFRFNVLLPWFAEEFVQRNNELDALKRENPGFHEWASNENGLDEIENVQPNNSEKEGGQKEGVCPNLECVLMKLEHVADLAANLGK